MKISLGFPPKLIGKPWGDTEYRIGMVPVGGGFSVGMSVTTVTPATSGCSLKP